MSKQRSSGMIVLGVVNIYMGGTGALAFALVALVSGYIAFVGGVSSAASEEGRRWAAAGGMGLVIAIPAAIAHAMLMMGGIGIMMRAGWSRKASLYGGASVAVLNILAMLFLGEVSRGGLLYAIYGALIVYLCTTPAWKAALTPGNEGTGAVCVAAGQAMPGVSR